MSERIGLVTFTTSLDNYGQVLQALATKVYLEKRGHKVWLLRRRGGKLSSIAYKLRKWTKQLLLLFYQSVRIKESLESQLQQEKRKQENAAHENLHPRYFENFRLSNFQIGTCDKSSIRRLRLTTLCAGSDQIWGFHNKTHFLQFGPKKLIRFSLASSTGNKQLTLKGCKKIEKWLKSFSFITVREESGVEMCHQLHYQNVHKVLDPSFLLDSANYEQYTFPLKDSNFLFVYLLKADTYATIEEICNFAKEQHLEMIYVTGQGRTDHYKKRYATIPEWLSLIKGAKFVITNSFHGMVFSVIFQKNFLVLPRIGKTSHMNERIFSLAGEFSLQSRIFSGDLREVLNPVDFSVAINKIKANRQFVDSLLKKNRL